MITLINTPGIKSFTGLQMHTPSPPLGLAYIAAAVKEEGFPYEVIDATGEGIDSIRPYPGRENYRMQGLSIEEIIDRIPEETDIIGVGCMFSSQWPLTRTVVQKIREHFPHALFVAGGEHVTAVPEHVLTHSAFDVCALGEGEETFIEIIKAYRSDNDLSKVAGIAYLQDGKVIRNSQRSRKKDINAVATPDWSSFPLEAYIERHQMHGVNLGRSIPMISTRGCPYGCTFCSNPTMWTKVWIPRDAKLVVDEIESYVKKYQIQNVDFQDLTAVVKRTWIVEFTTELINRKLNITWQMPSGTRSEVFDEEIAQLLYQSGCRTLAFAPESGSPEILKVIKKQVNLDKMIKAMRISVKTGLRLSCFIVVGFPDETKKTLRQTIKLIRKMALIGVYDIGVAKFVPYPGSELFYRLQRESKLDLDDKFFVSPMDFYDKGTPSYSDHVSTRRLYWTMMWMYLNFYGINFAVRPLRAARILWKAAVEGKEEARFAKWFVDRFSVRKRWKNTTIQGNISRKSAEQPVLQKV